MHALVGRGTDTPEQVERRLETADAELAAQPEFDHVVVNDRLEEAVDDAGRDRRSRTRPESLARPRRRPPALGVDVQESRTLEANTPDETSDQKGPALISPRIDKLLEHVDSDYASVVVAAKRARQINSYYHNLGEGTSTSSRRRWWRPARRTT